MLNATQIQEKPKSFELDQSIRELDLRRIMWKMADSEEGGGYAKETLEEDETVYRRFLHLHIIFTGMEIVPKMIDKVWHQHILDTKAYSRDCQEIFGSFLHHYPYFGMNGEEDQENLQRCFEKTQEAWVGVFGEPMFERKLFDAAGMPATPLPAVRAGARACK